MILRITYLRLTSCNCYTLNLQLRLYGVIWSQKEMTTILDKQERADVGIIVGRFQVHELHDGHRSLIDRVRSQHDRMIIFLGLSRLRNTLRNPLDFRARQRMINETYPDIDVHYTEDVRDDHAWSKELAAQIQKWTSPNQSVLLYGSRDSFLNNYFGQNPSAALEAEVYVSATEIRRRVANNYPPNKDYRAGMIAATDNRYANAFQTVDVAILNDDRTKVLLGRKPAEKQFRFIGGFSDPGSNSLEEDARREVMEEAGIEITDPVYVASMKIDDWRYHGEADCIKTALFVAQYQSGRPEGSDDVAEVRWFTLDQTRTEDLVPEHTELYQRLMDWVGHNPWTKEEI